jgi:acid phosphatase family membrane protein YuiD
VCSEQLEEIGQYLFMEACGNAATYRARPHTNKKTVITLDIRDCFGSITQVQVEQAFQTKMKLPEDLAAELSTKLCVDGKIPQGFSTSNFLTNLYLNDVLLSINKKIAKYHATMTIYVDDIAISGNALNSAEIINLVCTDLSRANLAVKKAKIKVMNSHTRQVIAGLVVNKGIRITKEKSKDLFASVADRSISQESLDGWLANLHMVDKRQTIKLTKFAATKGYETTKKK